MKREFLITIKATVTDAPGYANESYLKYLLEEEFEAGKGSITTEVNEVTALPARAEVVKMKRRAV